MFDQVVSSAMIMVFANSHTSVVTLFPCRQEVEGVVSRKKDLDLQMKRLQEKNR